MTRHTPYIQAGYRRSLCYSGRKLSMLKCLITTSCCRCWWCCCSVLHCRCTLQAELVPATRVSTAPPVSTMILGISPVSVTPVSTALAAKVSTSIGINFATERITQKLPASPAQLPRLSFYSTSLTHCVHIGKELGPEGI